MMTRLIHPFGEPPMTVRAGNFHRKGEGAPSALSLGYVAVDRSGSGVMTGRGLNAPADRVPFPRSHPGLRHGMVMAQVGVFRERRSVRTAAAARRRSVDPDPLGVARCCARGVFVAVAPVTGETGRTASQVLLPCEPDAHSMIGFR